MENIRTNKDERDNKYLKALAVRLEEVRKENNLSQEELAKATNLIREKIIYTEQNLKGRLLKVEDLAEIANHLNISVDYLLGLTDKKTTIAKRPTKSRDNVSNESTDLQGIIYNESNEDMFRLYKSIVYINQNTLTSTMEKIKQITEQKSTLSSLYINNISSAYHFIMTILTMDIPLFMINKRQEEIISLGAKALGNILYYNEDKELPMLFEDIESMKPVLEDISDYLLYKLSKCNIEKKIETTAMNNIQNERYYQATNEFITEYSKTLRPKK